MTVTRAFTAAVVWAAALDAVRAVGGAAVPVRLRGYSDGRLRRRSEILLRHLAIYTAVCGLGCSARSVAGVAGMSRRWVDVVVANLEAEREAGEVDELLNRLERQARALLVQPRERAA